MSVFFEHDFLELLFVRPANRRQGVATALVQAVEAGAATPKLFTSTNQSNVPMQRLCERLGFEQVGVVEGLDEGDPELFYLKRLGGRATTGATAAPPTPPAPRRSPAAPPGGRARRSRQSGSSVIVPLTTAAVMIATTQTTGPTALSRNHTRSAFWDRCRA